MAGPVTTERLTALLERIPVRTHRDVRVTWYDHWAPELDDALAALPEMPECPHELYRALLFRPAPTRKRVALVTHRGMALALVGVRRHLRHWILVTEGPAPRATVPHRPGSLIPALVATGLDIRINYWEGDLPPGPISDIGAISLPVSRMQLTTRADLEAYWSRDWHLRRALKRARSRTQGFTFDVDPPGGARWVIEHWAEHWADHPAQEVVAAADRVFAAEYLEARGRHHAFVLRDGLTPVAGNTFTVHGDELLWQVTYRDPAYDSHGVGNRALELVFEWALDAGLRLVNLGGGHDYKTNWAPQDGTLMYGFQVQPPQIRLAKLAMRRLERLTRR